MYRLKRPRVGGEEELRLFISDLGFQGACKAIAVHPTTMRRWLRGETPIPQAALQALYWLTCWGFQEAFHESHWSHQYLVDKCRRLEDQLAYLAPLHRREAANEAEYRAPGLVVPMDLA